MTIGLLLITHEDIGKQMIEAARVTLNGKLPMQCDVRKYKQDEVKKPKTGEYWSYISTPSNIANRCDKSMNIRIIAGVNLPMLFRILNYAHLELDEIVDKALSGGHDGIFLCDK